MWLYCSAPSVGFPPLLVTEELFTTTTTTHSFVRQLGGLSVLLLFQSPKPQRAANGDINMVMSIHWGKKKGKPSGCIEACSDGVWDATGPEDCLKALFYLKPSGLGTGNVWFFDAAAFRFPASLTIGSAGRSLSMTLHPFPIHVPENGR